MDKNKPLVRKAWDNQAGNTDSFLAPMPMTMYIVAPKRSGKTSLLISMLNDNNYLKNKFNKIIFVSPTANLDSKIQSLKSLEGLVKPNTDLINLLKKIQKKRKESILEDDIKVVPNISEIPTHLTDSDFRETLDLEELYSLLQEQKTVIENLGKKYADNALIILDDSITAKVLKSKQFIDFIFKSRHYKLSVIFISQDYHSLPKPLRLNNSQLLFFEIGNEKEIRSVYEENSSGLSFDKFYRIYQEIVSVPYNFLNINYFNSRKNRLIRNFESFIDTSKY